MTTASYQASIPGFCDHLGVNEQEARKLIKLSVSLAREAVQDHLTTVSEDKSTMCLSDFTLLSVLRVISYHKQFL